MFVCQKLNSWSIQPHSHFSAHYSVSSYQNCSKIAPDRTSDPRSSSARGIKCRTAVFTAKTCSVYVSFVITRKCQIVGPAQWLGPVRNLDIPQHHPVKGMLVQSSAVETRKPGSWTISTSSPAVVCVCPIRRWGRISPSRWHPATSVRHGIGSSATGQIVPHTPMPIVNIRPGALSGFSGLGWGKKINFPVTTTKYTQAHTHA